MDGRGTAGEALALKGDHLILTPHESYVIDSMIAKYNGGVWPLAFATSDEFIKDRFNASAVMHELGHLYGLHHHGWQATPNADERYRSIMSYRYTTLGVPQVDGDNTRYNIDFSRESLVNLDWRLGWPTGALSLVSGQHGERGDFYLQVGEFAQGLEAGPTEPSIDSLLADPAIASSLSDALVWTAEEGQRENPSPASPAPPTGAGSTSPTRPSPGPAGIGTTRSRVVIVRAPRRVTRRGLRRGIRVRVTGARPTSVLTASLSRKRHQLARRRTVTNASGATSVLVRLRKSKLRGLKRGTTLKLRVAYISAPGPAKQQTLTIRVK